MLDPAPNTHRETTHFRSVNVFIGAKLHHHHHHRCYHQLGTRIITLVNRARSFAHQATNLSNTLAHICSNRPQSLLKRALSVGGRRRRASIKSCTIMERTIACMHDHHLPRVWGNECSQFTSNRWKKGFNVQTWHGHGNFIKYELPATEGVPPQMDVAS